MMLAMFAQARFLLSLARQIQSHNIYILYNGWWEGGGYFGQNPKESIFFSGERPLDCLLQEMRVCISCIRSTSCMSTPIINHLFRSGARRDKGLLEKHGLLVPEPSERVGEVEEAKESSKT